MILLIFPDRIRTKGLFLHFQGIDDRVPYGLNEILFIFVQDGILGTPVGGVGWGGVVKKNLRYDFNYRILYTNRCQPCYSI